MIEEHQSSYYAVIPAPVLESDKLRYSEKIFYATISILANEKGYCYATNKYLAKKYNVHPKTVSDWISNLKRNGFLEVVLLKDANRKICQRRLYIIPLKIANNRYHYASKNI